MFSLFFRSKPITSRTPEISNFEDSQLKEPGMCHVLVKGVKIMQKLSKSWTGT